MLNVTDPTGKKVENITGLINTGSGFDITTRTGGFLIVADYDITSNSSVQATKQDWKVEVTLVNLDSDQTANAGKSLSGKIYVTKEQLSTYELAQISKMTTTTTYDSISATAEVTPGTAEVKKYYFASEEVTAPIASVDNGVRRLVNTNSKLTYIESNTPNYKFTNLKENSTYKIYSYVEDANGIKSNVYETEVTTDTYVIPKVDSVSHTSTLNSISLTVSASKGSNNIVSYLYSKDNGITYEESPNNTYTFSNLNDTTEYKIKVKVKDSLGRYSTEYYEAIATTTYILPVVTNVKTTTTYNSVTLNVTGTNGTNTIAKYKYSINNGPYQESANATYIFNGLNDNTNYSIKVIAVDTGNRESVVYTTSATTDKYILPTINDVITNTTQDSISISINGTNGTGNIVKYYYSKDGGSNYTESTNSNYTFNNLTSGVEYNIYVYVKDNNGRISGTYKKIVRTSSLYMAQVIGTHSFYNAKYADNFERYYIVHKDNTVTRYQDNWDWSISSAKDGYYKMNGITNVVSLTPFKDSNLYAITTDGKIMNYSCSFKETNCTGSEVTGFGNDIIQLTNYTYYYTKTSGDLERILAVTKDGKVIRYQDWSWDLEDSKDGYYTLSGVDKVKQITGYGPDSFYAIMSDGTINKYDCSYKGTSCMGSVITGFGTDVVQLTSSGYFYAKVSNNLDRVYALKKDGTVMRYQDWSWDFNDSKDGFHLLTGIDNVKFIAAYSAEALIAVTNDDKLMSYSCDYRKTSCTGTEIVL